LAQFEALDSNTYPRLPADVESYETCTDWRETEAPPPCDEKKICPSGWDLMERTYWDEASSSFLNCIDVSNFAQVVDLPSVTGFSCENLQFFFSSTDCCDDVGDQPTQWPTFAPTQAATNPTKPLYVATDFAAVMAATPVADSSIGTLTMVPTPAPTPVPTSAGYLVQEEQKSVAVISATLSFPLTEAQARDPVMKASLEGGVASSLGKPHSDVAITHIAGQQVQRRLVDALDLTFEITSSSTAAAEVQDLTYDFDLACTEGSLVAHVQEQAMQNGVLIAALQSMPRAMFTPTVTDSTKTVTVLVQVRAHEMRGDESDAPDTSTDDDDGSVGGMIAGIGVGIIVIGICVAIAVNRQKSPPSDGTPKPIVR
jgi:hypothetical protein